MRVAVKTVLAGFLDAKHVVKMLLSFTSGSEGAKEGQS